MDTVQQPQDREYSFPYHYLPRLRSGFSQHYYWSWGINYAATLEFINSRLIQIRFNSLIDIGCGDGRLVSEIAAQFPGKKIIGIDFSARAVNLARALNPGLTFQVKDIASGESLPPVDIVTLIEVLEHIPPARLTKFVSALAKLVRPGGTLILTVPHVNLPVQSKHYQHFSFSDLRSLFTSYFRVRRTFYLGRQGYLYQLILVLLGNRFFILNYPPAHKYLYSLFRRRLFISDERHCSRIYLEIKRK